MVAGGQQPLAETLEVASAAGEDLEGELFPLTDDQTPAPGTSQTGATVIKTVDGATVANLAGSRQDSGPIGLLAIIAAVCVVGVSAGAIRAIISQRASRAEFA